MEHHHTAQHHIFIGNEHCAVHCKSAFTVCAFCLPLAGLSLHSAKSRAFSSRRQRSCPNCLVLHDMPPRFGTLQRLYHCPDHVYRLLPHYLQPE